MSGRKRHLLVDTGGLVLKALVHAANVTDRLGGQHLVEAINDLAHTFPRLRHLWVDSAYQGSFVDWAEQTLGWTVSVVKRPSRWVWVRADQEPPEAPTGFQVLPRRWVVESTQPQYPPGALDVHLPACHDRAHRAAEPPARRDAAARSPGPRLTGKWCAMPVLASPSSGPVPLVPASAPPRPRPS